MENMLINKSFAEEYLACGQARDNMVFTACSNRVLDWIKNYLKNSQQKDILAVVELSRQDEMGFEQILESCTDEFQKNLLSQEFITSCVLRSAMINAGSKDDFLSPIEICNKFLDACQRGDFEGVKQLYTKAPMQYQVAYFVRKYGRLEMDFFLCDTQNKYIQRAINNFLSAREPYCVKVFSNTNLLPSYITSNGQRVESPHDYIDMNINNFLNDCSDYDNFN